MERPVDSHPNILARIASSQTPPSLERDLLGWTMPPYMVQDPEKDDLRCRRQVLGNPGFTRTSTEQGKRNKEQIVMIKIQMVIHPRSYVQSKLRSYVHGMTAGVSRYLREALKFNGSWQMQERRRCRNTSVRLMIAF